MVALHSWPEAAGLASSCSGARGLSTWPAPPAVGTGCFLVGSVLQLSGSPVPRCLCPHVSVGEEAGGTCSHLKGGEAGALSRRAGRGHAQGPDQGFRLLPPSLPRCEPKQRPRPHGEVPLWQAPLTPGRRRTGQGLPAIGASFCSPHYAGGPGVAGMAPALRPSLGLTCYTQSWAGPSSSSSTQATDTPGLGWRIGPHLTDLTCWPWAAREAGLDAGGLDSQPSRASDSQCGRSQALPQLQAPSTQHRACQLWLRASILGCTGPCLLSQPCPIAGPVPWWVRAMTRAETLTPIVPWGTASCHWAS